MQAAAKSHQDKVDIKRQSADAARERSLMHDELVLEVLERRTEGIRNKLVEDQDAKLTGPDLSVMRDLREISQARAERLELDATNAGAVPADPRFQELGYALFNGDLVACWKVLDELRKSKEWIELRKYSVGELSSEELSGMPQGLRDASNVENEEVDTLDAAALHDLCQEVDVENEDEGEKLDQKSDEGNT